MEEETRVCGYHGYVIWKNEQGFHVALGKSGTDSYFETLYDAMDRIDEIKEGGNENGRI